MLQRQDLVHAAGSTEDELLATVADEPCRPRLAAKAAFDPVPAAPLAQERIELTAGMDDPPPLRHCSQGCMHADIQAPDHLVVINASASSSSGATVP